MLIEIRCNIRWGDWEGDADSCGRVIRQVLCELSQREDIDELRHDSEKFCKAYSSEEIRRSASKLYNVVITLPGIPKQQIKYGNLSNILPDNERHALRLMGIHRAIADNAVLIELASSNAIHEIMQESKGLQHWLYGKNKNGILRLQDFELNRANNRGIRPAFIYQDTIQILKEMLNEEGLEGKYDAILDHEQFFPEASFYQFLGAPENIMIYNDVFEMVDS